jgi:hypothetical protein
MIGSVEFLAITAVKTAEGIKEKENLALIGEVVSISFTAFLTKANILSGNADFCCSIKEDDYGIRRA